MKLKLSQLVQSINALATLSNKEFDDIGVAFQIAENVQLIDTKIDIYNQLRRKIVEKYGERDDKDNLVQNENGNIPIQDKYKQDFMKEMDALDNQEVELDVRQIKLSDLRGTHGVKPQDILSIMYMINREN